MDSRYTKKQSAVQEKKKNEATPENINVDISIERTKAKHSTYANP